MKKIIGMMGSLSVVVGVMVTIYLLYSLSNSYSMLEYTGNEGIAVIGFLISAFASFVPGTILFAFKAVLENQEKIMEHLNIPKETEGDSGSSNH